MTGVQAIIQGGIIQIYFITLIILYMSFNLKGLFCFTDLVGLAGHHPSVPIANSGKTLQRIVLKGKRGRPQPRMMR